MPATSDAINAETPTVPTVPTVTSVTRSRATLSIRAGVLSRSDPTSSATRNINVGRTSSSADARPQNGVVPLKRLTAGRKELKIGHDGATYLLRITKSNKLILTKNDDAKQGGSIS